MDNQDILYRIQALVEEEHQLRGAEPPDGTEADPTGSADGPDRARLRQVGEELDQCWDLLRQRRAKSQVGANPDDATVRAVNEVESYRQ
jgi:hypothetical protein